MKDTASLLQYSPFSTCQCDLVSDLGVISQHFMVPFDKIVFSFTLFENVTIFYCFSPDTLFFFSSSRLGVITVLSACVGSWGEGKKEGLPLCPHSLLGMPSILVQNQLSSLLNRSSNSVVVAGTLQPKGGPEQHGRQTYKMAWQGCSSLLAVVQV